MKGSGLRVKYYKGRRPFCKRARCSTGWPARLATRRLGSGPVHGGLWSARGAVVHRSMVDRGGAGVAWAGSMVDRPRGGTGLRSTADRGRDRAGARGGRAGRGGAMAGLAASSLCGAVVHGRPCRGHERVARGAAGTVRRLVARKRGRGEWVSRRGGGHLRRGRARERERERRWGRVWRVVHLRAELRGRFASSGTRRPMGSTTAGTFTRQRARFWWQRDLGQRSGAARASKGGAGCSRGFL